MNIPKKTAMKKQLLASILLAGCLAGEASAFINNPMLSPKKMKELAAKNDSAQVLSKDRLPPAPPPMVTVGPVSGQAGMPSAPVKETVTTVPPGLSVSVVVDDMSMLRYPIHGAQNNNPMLPPVTSQPGGSMTDARTSSVMARHNGMVQIEDEEYRVRIHGDRVTLLDRRGKVAWSGGVESTETPPKIIEAKTLQQPDSTVATRIAPTAAVAGGIGAANTPAPNTGAVPPAGGAQTR